MMNTMMNTLTKAVSGLLLFAAIFVLACPGARPRGGQKSPQKAVITWLAALDEHDVQRLVELSPPGLDKTQREELRLDLGARLAPYTRLPEAPFSLSDPEEGKATARVQVRKKGGGETALVLELTQVGSKWYVRPPRLDETPAG